MAILNEQLEKETKLDTIEIWELSTVQLIKVLPIEEFSRAKKESALVQDMSFSVDNRYLAIAAGVISIWDIQEGKCINTLVTKLRPENNTLASATQYDAVKYSPDGTKLAAVI